MKTWEMIKELTENPNKTFAILDKDENKYKTVAYLDEKDERIVFKPLRDKPLKINDVWIEINSSVDFMTAINAYEDGKTICCITDGIIIKYNPNENGVDYGKVLKDTKGCAIDTYQIKYGKWYIED